MAGELTAEEIELTRGMPPHVAQGFINAHRRAAVQPDWAKIAEEIHKLQPEVFDQPKR